MFRKVHHQRQYYQLKFYNHLWFAHAVTRSFHINNLDWIEVTTLRNE